MLEVKELRVIVIGAGAAGFAASIRASELGEKVTMINGGTLGGTCVNVGCVPSKRLILLAEKLRELRGLETVRVDPMQAFRDKEDLVHRLRKTKYQDVLPYYDIELIEGRARFVSPSALKVDGKLIEGDRFIIATGSRPSPPPVPVQEGLDYWDSERALSPDRDIESLVVVGGRSLGVEMAQMYSMLGKDVVLLQRGPSILPDWEPEIASSVRRFLTDEGVRVYEGVGIKEVLRGEQGKTVRTDRGEVEADEVLFATGRIPNVDLALSEAGVELNPKGGIKVFKGYVTTNPKIYAAGDVLGGPMLEPLAGRQGTLAVENAIQGTQREVDLDSLPRAVYTVPPAVKVGLTEEEARGRGLKVKTVLIKAEDIPRAHIEGDTRGVIKLVYLHDTGEVVGVHAALREAHEIGNIGSVVIKNRVKVTDLEDTVMLFPTMGESIRISAIGTYREPSKMSCCV